MARRHAPRRFLPSALPTVLLPVLLMPSPVRAGQALDPCIATKATIAIERSLAKGWYLVGTGTMECGFGTGSLEVSFTKWEKPCCGVPIAIQSGIAQEGYIGPGTTLTITHNLEGGEYCWSTYAEVLSAGIFTSVRSDLICED